MGKLRILVACLIAVSFAPPPAVAEPLDDLDADDFISCETATKDVLLENALNPSPAAPNFSFCGGFDGQCTLTVTAHVQKVDALVILVVFNAIVTTVDAKYSTEIDCSGTWGASVVSWGGSGPRFATLTAVGANQHAAEAANNTGPTSTCHYVAPLGACKTPDIGGKWTYKEVVDGKASGVSQGCLPLLATNQFEVPPDLRPVIDRLLTISTPTTLGSSICHSKVKVTVVDKTEEMNDLLNKLQVNPFISLP